MKYKRCTSAHHNRTAQASRAPPAGDTPAEVSARVPAGTPAPRGSHAPFAPPLCNSDITTQKALLEAIASVVPWNEAAAKALAALRDALQHPAATAARHSAKPLPPEALQEGKAASNKLINAHRVCG